MSLTFYGKRVSWTTRGTTKSTRVAVYIDGKRRSAHTVSGLKANRHTLRIVVLSGTFGLRSLHVG